VSILLVILAEWLRSIGSGGKTSVGVH
jgi:hypothetical protein